MPPVIEKCLAKVRVPAGTVAVIGTWRTTSQTPPETVYWREHSGLHSHVKGVAWKWTPYHFAVRLPDFNIILEFPDNKIVRFKEDQ